MDGTTVTVNGVEYAPINRNGRQFQIVVLHRGFVFVGDVDRSNANEIVIHDAKNVRRWGTTKGLGELAQSGPLSNTKLDEAGTIRFSPLAEICSYDCNPAKWDR
jgi:hypothetical protein